MSLKQDGTRARTAADLELKYNFGKTFAEVYGLASDAQKAAQEAQMAVDGLDHEEIFNRLTNYGDWQGIYRDSKGDVYINASYIKAGTLSGDRIATGAISSDKIEANAITTAKIETGAITTLKIATGAITATQIASSTITGDKIAAGAIDADHISAGAITADHLAAGAITADKITSGTFTGSNLVLDGLLAVKEGLFTYGYVGATTGMSDGDFTTGAVLTDSTASNGFIATTAGARMTYSGTNEIYCAGSGCYSTSEMKVSSDARLKNSISYDLSKEEKMFSLLAPCSFAYNRDKSSKRHWGFVAQEFVEGAEQASLDVESLDVVAKDESGMYAIAYGEMVALNTHMIQKLMARVSALEEKLV